METITGPLAEALKRGRQIFNAKFAAANSADRPIDAADFQRHLALTLDPIVRTVAANFAERTDAVVEALYDLSLDLFRHSLLGPNAMYPAVPEAWRNLLPRIPRLLGREPARVAGSVTNAIYNLSRTRGARVHDWCSTDYTRCQTVDEFLDCAAVVAWRCGLPQYRQSALEKAAALPTHLATVALDLAPNTQPEVVEDVLRNLAANPWLPPCSAHRPPPPRLRIVGRAGAFRGFAGQFLTPPKVQCVGGELIAS